jgi:aspartate ammonia-lyase
MTHAEVDFRTEEDFLGKRRIPTKAYWGIHTDRAAESCCISGQTLGGVPGLIRALAWIKKAAAHANAEFRIIDGKLAQAISMACEEIAAGHLHDQFIVDVIQGGAGTSTNMNANEVIANRALELLGCKRGDYDTLHPNNHVNASQSTSDVYPTAWRLAAWFETGQLLDAMASLRECFARKAFDLNSVLTIGAPKLQDAVPMALGQELQAYAAMIGEDEACLREARQLMLEIHLGATPIGGVDVPPGHAERVVQRLAAISSAPVVRAPNMAASTRDTGAFLQLSGVLKRVACKLGKTCNDLGLTSSGFPGFGDIVLPRQAGRSIMPGKVNPAIPELVNQVAFEVVGNHVTITMASEAGQFPPNAFEPIIGWSLFKSIRHLSEACVALKSFCVDRIVANHEVLERRVTESATVVTALPPVMENERAALLPKFALSRSGTLP